MSLRVFFISILAVSVSACATVDIADMASGGQGQVIDVSTQKNVVIKATEALQTSFQDREWEQAPAKNGFKSAANVLLRGMKKASAVVTHKATSQATPVMTLTSLRTDILDAGKQVAKTVKAAEIYIEVAEPNADLKLELKALEKAYMSSRRAEVWFEKSLNKIEGVDAETELSTFSVSVRSLRESTNLYGDNVRARARAMKAPAS